MKYQLSIVINTHNVKPLLLDCLASIYHQQAKTDHWQIIVCDMASSDGTVEAVKSSYPKVEVLAAGNLGFAKGNNIARPLVKSDYVLFLNPDTIVNDNVIQKTLSLISTHPEFGAVGCKVMLSNGKLDYSCHRGLPTIWNSLSYFSGLSKLFPHTKFFSGYEATFLDYNQSHTVDCITGAYLLIRKDLLDQINWWDEDYYWNGEDIELCYQIKKAGFQIWYESSVTITHFKGSSSGLYKTGKVAVPKPLTQKLARSASKSMSIFLKKHWRELGPAPIVILAWLGIWVLEKIRLTKIALGQKYA